MNTRNIIRAWKDEEYRMSLSDAERAMLPAHPSGLVELTDAELDDAVGGAIAVRCDSIVRVGGCTTVCIDC
jgi:mersacidin/lichenicidin family type 2 lantibiotic